MSKATAEDSVAEPTEVDLTVEEETADEAAETPTNRLAEIETGIADEREKLSTALGDKSIYLFMVPSPSNLDAGTVESVYDELRQTLGEDGEALAVIVDSPGGDIHAAYNLAKLFRRYATKELLFIVPRWAKSAATLLVCAGDRILMTPIAELGPIDPQITFTSPVEGRVEHFSPLAIESTLDLIREEFAKGEGGTGGSKQLAEGLMERLQFPLTLGGFKTSIEIGKEYLSLLLNTRMMKENTDQVSGVVKRLTEGYTDHGFCINCDELRDEMGLPVEELGGPALDSVWAIHKLNSERNELQAKRRREEMAKRIRELPPELLRNLPNGFELADSTGKRKVV